MNNILITILLLFFTCILSPQVQATENYAQMFTHGKYYEVKQVGDTFYILSSSPFKDAEARRNLDLLSKAVLLRFMQDTDKKVTGLELKHFKTNTTWEANGRLFAVSIIKQKDISKNYEPSTGEAYNALKAEIRKLETLQNKTKDIHEQLKELYFITGDLDNFDKQTDILMDIKFNAN